MFLDKIVKLKVKDIILSGLCIAGITYSITGLYYIKKGYKLGAKDSNEIWETKRDEYIKKHEKRLEKYKEETDLLEHLMNIQFSYGDKVSEPLKFNTHLSTLNLEDDLKLKIANVYRNKFDEFLDCCYTNHPDVDLLITKTDTEKAEIIAKWKCSVEKIVEELNTLESYITFNDIWALKSVAEQSNNTVIN